MKNGLIDLHCHILFDIDDGAKDLDESIQMCELYLKNGFIGAAVTPHFHFGGKFMPTKALIEERIHLIQQELDARQIPFKLYSGMEIRLFEKIPEYLKNGTILPINHGKYVLIEPPFSTFPEETLSALFQIQVEGYIPIIAHPERNEEINRDLSIAQKLHAAGILLQVNTGSLLGNHGETAANYARELLKNGLVHLLSTDAHNTRHRTPNLKDLEKKLHKLIGPANTNLLLKENPHAILHNAPTSRMILSKKMQKKNRFAKIIFLTVSSLLLLGAGLYVAAVEAVDYAFEKFIGSEVLKDPELAKQLNAKSLRRIRAKLADNRQPPEMASEDDAGIMDDSNIPLLPGEEELPAQDLPDSVTNRLNRIYSRYVKKKVFTNRDRFRVMEILYVNLPESDLSRFEGMFADGLTDEEITEIKTTMKQYLSGEEIDELKALFVKYENSLEG